MIKNFESYVNNFIHKLNEEIEFDYYDAPQEYIDEINNDFYLYKTDKKGPVFNELDPYNEEEWDFTEDDNIKIINKTKYYINKISYDKSSEGIRDSIYKIFIIEKEPVPNELDPYGEEDWNDDDTYIITYRWCQLEDFEENFTELLYPANRREWVRTVVKIISQNHANLYGYMIDAIKLKEIRYDNNWIYTGCNY